MTMTEIQADKIKVGVVGGRTYYLSEGQLVSAGRPSSSIEYQTARKVAEVEAVDNAFR